MRCVLFWGTMPLLVTGKEGCWWLRNGPCSKESALSSCEMNWWRTQANIHMEFPRNSCGLDSNIYLKKKMKFAYPTISLKSTHPAITLENSCIIISINGDNRLNLLWQKRKATQFSFSSSSIENVLSQFALRYYSGHFADSFRAYDVDKAWQCVDRGC